MVRALAGRALVPAYVGSLVDHERHPRWITFDFFFFLICSILCSFVWEREGAACLLCPYYNFITFTYMYEKYQNSGDIIFASEQQHQQTATLVLVHEHAQNFTTGRTLRPQ